NAPVYLRALGFALAGTVGLAGLAAGVGLAFPLMLLLQHGGVAMLVAYLVSGTLAAAGSYAGWSSTALIGRKMMPRELRELRARKSIGIGRAAETALIQVAPLRRYLVFRGEMDARDSILLSGRDVARLT